MSTVPFFRTTALLIAIALSGGCSAAHDECRSLSEACAQTSDCCTGLACTQGVCAAPSLCQGDTPIDCGAAVPGRCCPRQAPFCCAADRRCHASAADCGGAVCGSQGKPCATSATCCTGLTCQAKVCAAPPSGAVCGNGTCEAGESTSTCCADCGCPAGTTCQANQCKAPTGTTLTWSLTNNCQNGEDVEVRFFAVDRGLEWPGGDLVYLVAPGATMTQALSCVPGETICLGADQPATGLFWGVDIDNSARCTDCCFLCVTATVSYGPLTCR